MFISIRIPPTAAPRPRSTREKNAPRDDKPLSNSNCTQCFSSRMPPTAAPGPRSTRKETPLLTTSNCLERLREFQLKMHRGRGGEGDVGAGGHLHFVSTSQTDFQSIVCVSLLTFNVKHTHRYLSLTVWYVTEKILGTKNFLTCYETTSHAE